MIRVDTIENSVIRRSIDIRKTMYNENIDCNYAGIAAIFRAGAHPEVYTPLGIPSTFRNVITRVLAPRRFTVS